MRRQYSDQDKAAALAFYDACKSNLTQAARLSQIPRNTLRRWVSERELGALGEIEEGEELGVEEEGQGVELATLATPSMRVATPKGEVLRLWEELRESCFKDLKAARLEASFRDLVTAAKIATDMSQALRGTYDDDDIEELLAEFVAVVKKHVTDEHTQAQISEELRRAARKRSERA